MFYMLILWQNIKIFADIHDYWPENKIVMTDGKTTVL